MLVVLVLENRANLDSAQLTVGSFNVENLDPGDGAAKFNQLAALIITGPAPASAQASWTPSVVRTYRIRWLTLFMIRRHSARWNELHS